jgi:Spy/CpxP family protein refolding chaperone
MRTVVIRSVVIWTMATGMACAQQAANPDQSAAEALRAELRAMQAQLEARRAAEPSGVNAQAQALAQIQALKAELAAAQARLEDLRQRYTNGHPDVVTQKARVEELRDREVELTRALQRTMDAPASLKQSGGGLQTGLADRWWKNPAAAQYLGLTADQQKRMDDVFQESRLKLSQLNFTLEREEKILERLVAVEPLDDSKMASQIDSVAQARAELEKANGRMLLGIRKQLTPEQWSKLNQISSLAQATQK